MFHISKNQNHLACGIHLDVKTNLCVYRGMKRYSVTAICLNKEILGDTKGVFVSWLLSVHALLLG